MVKTRKRAATIKREENEHDSNISPEADIKTEECKQEIDAKRLLHPITNDNNNSNNNNNNNNKVSKTTKKIGRTKYTDEDIRKLIHYIVEEELSVPAAGRKVNMDRNCARRFYLTYVESGNKIPTREDRRSPRRLYEEHKQFIASLYKEESDEGMTCKKVTAALTEHFPELEINRDIVERFLKTEMPMEFELTNRHRHKFLNHHIEFVSDLIRDNVGISRAEIYTRFVERFPNANLKKDNFFGHVYKQFGHIPNSPETVTKENYAKHYPEYMTFVKRRFDEDKKMSLNKAVFELKTRFPDRSITYGSIHHHLKSTDYEFYKKHIRNTTTRSKS